MALPRHKTQPNAYAQFEPRPRPRAAGEHDAPVGSPVHALYATLDAELSELPEPYVPHYPGWFRLGFPIVSSIALWGAIAWVWRVLA